MTDPHAKRRLADGRNSWKKLGLTPGAREEFVRWLLDNGLEDVVAHQRAAREQLDHYMDGKRSELEASK
jgi:hypothetical protein|tara:strand:- start:477 stop:683 length:207 start_codon:yes stop_codon:yes gene_type:complete